MYTKQEKLAAARKKLKEFQGKQRENDSTRSKNMGLASGVDGSTHVPSSANPLNSKFEYCDGEHVNCGNSFFPDMSESHDQSGAESQLKANAMKGNDSANDASDSEYSKFPVFTFSQDTSNNFSLFNISDKATNSEVSSKDLTAVDRFAVRAEQSKYANGLYDSEMITQSKGNPSGCREGSECDNNLNSELITTDKAMSRESLQNCGMQTSNNTTTTTRKSDPHSGGIPSEAFNPSALQNAESFASPISQLSVPQLIEERNNLLQVLRKTEEFLKYKTDQVENLSQNISFLQSRVKDLEGNVATANREAQSLRARNDELMAENEGNKTFAEQLKRNFEGREEQLSELQQKFEMKTSECQKLSSKLEEVQAQLSASLIKVQQLSIGESPAFTSAVSDLQSENASLSQRLREMEKNLEVLDAEREQSNHNFHTYAQQCNNQLASLSSEIRNLTKENQLLADKNNILNKSLKELENQKAESEPEAENTALTDMTHKLHILSEENLSLQAQLNQKMEQIQGMERESREREEAMREMEAIADELRSENAKLVEEREGANSNQKLLAAMESDKVAAARAVAQNQKLKDQLTELEEGFIKLSHEKLQLADELAHEKHVNKELELKLKDLTMEEKRAEKREDDTINEGEDVEELRAIIRQLEDDKTELLFRLNASNANSKTLGGRARESAEPEVHRHGGEGEGEEKESEDSRAILQKMEEKVKRTMNEIAALDEEKERLEHLVLQLQGETETIGEYISIYQTQRMLLRQRNKEKDDQLLQLAKDKEELKTKLSTLDDLVHHLLSEKGDDVREIPALKEGQERVARSDDEPAADTAVKIQALISEIQKTNLIDNQTVAFEHCPCCSGRLITI